MEHRLIAAMEEEVAAKTAEIEHQAAETVRAIGFEAERTLAETQAAEETRVQERLLQYVREQHLRLENEWRIRVGQLQFEVAAQVLDELARTASGVRQRDNYPAAWRRLFTEALGVYRRERSDTPVLQVAPADRELAQCHAPDLARIEVNDAVPDGVELLSPDRHLRVQNTVPSRLRQGREEFLKTISEAIKERLEKAEVTHDE